MSDAAANVTDRAGDAKDRVSEKLGGMGGGVSNAAHQLKERAREARYGISSFMDDSPLAAGAIAFGLGLAGGFAVPSTRLEEKAIGETARSLPPR